MLKRILLICTISLSVGANAQFTIDEDTLHAYGYAAPSALDFADIFGHTILRHQGGAVETIKWVRTDNTLPDAQWSSAICDIINCRAPEVDTGSFQIGGTDTGALSFHFYPKNIRGEGSMTVRFSRASNPLEFVDVVVLCQAWKATSITSVNNSSPILYPNPAVNTLKVELPEIEQGNLEIMDFTGKVVFSGTYVSGQIIDINSLESGAYTLRISNAETVATQQFIKE